MVASEERINDVFILKRLTASEANKIVESSVWPEDFKKYKTLLNIGRESGVSWAFENPLSLALIYSTVDLAKENPGISTKEIADLLQIGLNQAEALADEAFKDAGVKIIRPNKLITNN